MSITIPKPLIPVFTKPLPAWIFAVALVAQFATSHTGKTPSPTCNLKFENFHYSTSVKKNNGIDAIKMNVKSQCTSPQRETTLTANMEVLKNGHPEIFYTSLLTKATADAKNIYEATFLQFWEPCAKDQILLLRGKAHGFVTLQNNEVVPVSDDTGKFTPVLCGFPAK